MLNGTGYTVEAGGTGRWLHFSVVDTIPKPRKGREFPEVGLIVSKLKTLANNHFTTEKTPAARCGMEKIPDGGGCPVNCR